LFGGFEFKMFASDEVFYDWRGKPLNKHATAELYNRDRMTVAVGPVTSN
jgi:hypothetical protein